MRQLTPLRLDTFPNFKRGSVQVHEPAAAASAASLDPRRPPPQQQIRGLSHIAIDRSRINQLVGRGRARVPTIERKRNEALLLSLTLLLPSPSFSSPTNNPALRRRQGLPAHARLSQEDGPWTTTRPAFVRTRKEEENRLGCPHWTRRLYLLCVCVFVSFYVCVRDFGSVRWLAPPPVEDRASVSHSSPHWKWCGRTDPPLPTLHYVLCHIVRVFVERQAWPSTACSLCA